VRLIVIILLFAIHSDVLAQDKNSATSVAGAEVVRLMTKCLSDDSLRAEKDKQVEVKIENDTLLIVEDTKDNMRGYKIPLKEIDRVYRPGTTVLGCRKGTCVTEIYHFKVFAKPSTSMKDAYDGPSCGIRDDSRKDDDALHEAFKQLIASYN
jgi:hypothetical protein